MYYGETVINESYLGDIDYFDSKFLDNKFKELENIEDVDDKSKKIAQLLNKMILNIGSTCTKAINMKKLYKSNYKYNRVIAKYCKKYLPMIIDKDKILIKKAIDNAFVGDIKDSFIKLAVGLITDKIVPREFNFIKNAFQKFSKADPKDSKIKTALQNLAAIFYSMHKNKYMKQGMSEKDAINKARPKGLGLYNNLENKVKKSESTITWICRQIPQEIISNIFFEICPIKFRSIGEALVTYKQSAKYNNFLSESTKKGAQYCFDITYAVMQDIMQVYKDL